VEQGGMEVVHVHRVLDRMESEVIGRTVSQPAPDAAEAAPGEVLEEAGNRPIDGSTSPP